MRLSSLPNSLTKKNVLFLCFLFGAFWLPGTLTSILLPQLNMIYLQVSDQEKNIKTNLIGKLYLNVKVYLFDVMITRILQKNYIVLCEFTSQSRASGDLVASGGVMPNDPTSGAPHRTICFGGNLF